MWQPIETAPRDQTFLAVLNCAGEQTICTMRWPVAEAKNSRPDNKTFHVERVTHWMPLPELPGAQPTPKAVAYLDLGVGGYMDIGTDLTDEELGAIPKGRHMLGIVGTYGIEGYVPAQPAPSAPSEEAAAEMGANGGHVVEAERLAFEAWMRGHRWKLGAKWTGTEYRSAFEKGGMVDTHAMRTRKLWAAWRDRAALAAPKPEAKP